MLIDNDTVVALSVPETKALLKQLYKGERDSVLLCKCEEQLSLKDTVIAIKEVQLQKSDSLISELNAYADEMTERLARCENKRRILAKQRTVLGIVAAALTLILLL